MFADVILPVSVPKAFTYGVPVELQDKIQIGARVQVEFGKRKRYAGIVSAIHQRQPEQYNPKPILSVIDQTPLVTKRQLTFWNWLSKYYMANLGDVMAIAIPSALKLSSESTVQLLMDADEFDAADLTDEEFLIFEALSKQAELKIEDIQLILDKKNIYPILTSLIEQRIVAMKETLKERYKPKLKAFVKLKETYLSEEGKQELLNQVDKAPKQLQVILTLLSKFSPEQWIEKKKLEEASSCSASIIKALVEKGYLHLERKEVSRLTNYSDGDLTAQLSKEQQKGYQTIKKAFAEQKPCLLHGVTGSGKTHIYIKLIEEQLKAGKQSLYLLPEIALTSQIINRLKNHFGREIGVYHSKFSDAERVEIWNATLSGQFKVIVGARSSMFLPFKDLGLIIVDEEHDSSYKQYDPSPRYQARDCALYLSKQYQANILLGSATPSFESYFNAKMGKYELVELSERYGNMALPEIEIVNMRKQNIPGKKYNRFSKRLIDELRQTVEENKQAILFRNRRGYSSFIQCNSCANNIKCIHCDVSLTYHKYRDQLECHYCGFKQKVPHRCPSCGHTDIERIGLGTERIEEELSVFIPSAKLGRMDLDTTRNKNGHEKIIGKFERKEIDILVGTQMVTKGLHFNDVKIVGVLNADSILKFPDFRASERAFQLLEQVSGRAGRKGQQGRVLIQVRDEKDIVLTFLKTHDYIGFFNATIDERKEWFYPPFYRQIKLTLKHKDWKVNYAAAILLVNTIRAKTKQGVKGPSEPSVSKVNNYFLQEIIITLEKKNTVIQHTKSILQDAVDFVQKQKGNSQLRINIDVDPM